MEGEFQLASMMSMHSLVRLLFPTGHVRQVWLGPLAGMRFVVMPGMGLTYALGQDHWHFHLLLHHLRSGMTVFDVGANCGQTALFFSRQTGNSGQVYAFEPVPQNAAVLRRNLELNQCANVSVVEAAVAADSSPRRFCFDAGHHTMGTLEGAMVKLEEWETTLEVCCLTLDNFVDGGARPPDLIKIDVEGSGLGVIEGAARLIEAHRPMIYFELHAADAASPELQAVAMLRERWGYEITDLNGSLSGPYGTMWGGAVWCSASNRP